MRVRIDDERCKGHGMCCTSCPELFELTDDGFAIVLMVEVPKELEDAARTAVEQCPEHAISVSD